VVWAPDGPVSGTSKDYFRSVSVYDQNIDEYIGVFSNGTDSVKFFSVVANAYPNTYSDFTFIDSIDSTVKARDVAAVNDRLILVNLEDAAGTRFPTRVLWSARGNPRSFLIDDGAGAEDLMEMRGEIQAAIRFRDFMLLFTEYEIWRATPTLDSYAFRFDRVADNVGCPFPKTIAVTPHGVVFMEHHHEVFITDGSTVAPLGPAEAGGPSRIHNYLHSEVVDFDRMWSLYNHSLDRYELYYATAASTTGYPVKSLWYTLSSRAWWPQMFSHELSSGVDIYDPVDFISYDEVDDAYDDIDLTYDDYDVRRKRRRINVFTSGGVNLRFDPDATDDDGEIIDARWRSPGLHGGAPHRQAHLTEIWTDFVAPSSSSASLFVGAARNSSAFDDGTSIALSVAGDAIFTPTWKTGTAPNFEIRIADGGTPKIVSFQATIKDASRF
jgi:hypothetical protein